jgi:hypothetical protein
MRVRWVQPSLFRRPRRTLVWFFPTKNVPAQKLSVHTGGTRAASRRYTIAGDSWLRKSKGRMK